MKVEQQLEYHLIKIIKDLPQELKFIQDDIYLAGDAIVSLLHKERPNDIDIYFKSEDIKNKFESIVKNNITFWKLINCYETKNYTLDLKVQFVTKLTGLPEKIIETFDFMHCKVYFENDKIMYGKGNNNFLNPQICIDNRLIVLNEKCAYPIKALERMMKFIERKYSVHKSVFIDLPLMINNLDLSTEEKLKKNIEGLYSFKTIQVHTVFKKLHSNKFNNKMDIILK